MSSHDCQRLIQSLETSMADPFVGQIIAVGFDFVPLGWLPCDGALYPIAEYQPLSLLLGTTYGGDGQTTFAVPDLRGRAAVCQGQGPGLSDYALGQTGGAESVTLMADQIGAHGHVMNASKNAGTTDSPVGGGQPRSLANITQVGVNMYGKGDPDVTLAPDSIPFTSSDPALPHENRQPLQVINYIICWQGVFPSQG
jgi:microcystin-dependent protein